MRRTALASGFRPKVTAFDSWYASLANLKLFRHLDGHWFTRLKANRLVSPNDRGNVALSAVEIPPEGQVVHLKGDRFIRVFRTVATDGDVEHWATSDLSMTEAERAEWVRQAFGIEGYHRGIKQCCGIEKCPAQKAAAQRGHIQLALRAFGRLEAHWLHTVVGWYEAKTDIIRTAVRDYLAHSTYTLAADATA